MRPRSRAIRVLICAFVATLLMPSAAWAQRVPRFERENVDGRDAVAREVLVKFRNPLLIEDLADIASQTDALSVERIGTTGTLRVRSRSQSAAALIRALARRLDVVYAEPNHIIQIAAIPSDPSFGDLWGLEQIGAPAAWDLTVGANSNVVVGVIDTGIDYTHPDLAANIWSAPAAFTVTLSSGAVTCAAGTHGFNAITRQCNPMDDQNHGTHVSGTIGAVGDNGVGVAGVNWNARMMGLKFLDESGSGSMADAIATVEFAIAVKQAFQSTDEANIRVLSASWGGSQFSQALLDQINAANDSDMLFVAAAGNNGTNNDILPFFPAGYTAPNVVTVAATTFDDTLTWFSNYGQSSVHLAAPGDTILSTTPGNTYSYFSGTSMAAPHVSGAAALVLSLCTLDTATLKSMLLSTVDQAPDLAGTTVTGGRLNVNSALHACTAPPGTPQNLSALGADTRVTLTWSAVPGAMHYRVKRSLTAGGPYTVIAPDVNGVAYADTDVVNGTAYYYVVSAENTLGESGDSNEATATPAIPPDLTISALTAPATGGAGVPVSVSVTTSNTGSGVALPSVTRIYLSDNSTLDASDTGLVDIAVPELGPGGVNALSLPVNIPSGTVAGRYYLIAAADADGLLAEGSEGNNRTARAILIGPDLSISPFTAPGSGAAGSVIAVTDGTRNTGGGTAAPTTTAFYLSTNTTFSADDVLLGSRAVPPVSAGATDTATTSLTIPANTDVGTYYVLAIADAGGVLGETTETNNSNYRSILIGGDLITSSFTVPSSGAPGSTIVVTDTVKNVGTGTAGATTTRFYLSTNSSLDSGDTLLAEGRAVPALDAGLTHSGQTTVTLPAGLPAASYYIIAKADGNADVPETSETNNWAARTIPIGGDLVVSAFTAPSTAASGAEISVTDTVTNQGGGMATASVTKFYLSSNTTFESGDTLLAATRLVPDLAGGTNSAGTTMLTLPSGLTAATYYLIAHADGDKTVAETSESNNTLSRVIQIGGDLVVSAMTVPVKAGAGLPLTITETTTNQGAGSVPPTVTKFYLSVNASWDSADTLIGSRDVAALANGGSSAVSTTLVIPSNVTAGTYSVIAKADADGSAIETSESNNTLARGVSIGADLLVSVPSGTIKGAAGLSFEFTDTVTNSGGGASATSTTRYYLSTNTTLSADDVLLGGGREVTVLAPSGSSTGSTTVWLPASASPGVFYVVVKADGDNAVGETSETNNTSSRQIAVGPDLVISTASAPGTVVAGSTITVTDTVLNQGADGAVATSTRFYLSRNTTLDATDIALDALRDVPAIAAGASSAGTTSVVIPATTPAAFYYLLVKADGDNGVGESYETNNVMVRTMWVTAAP